MTKPSRKSGLARAEANAEEATRILNASLALAKSMKDRVRTARKTLKDARKIFKTTRKSYRKASKQKRAALRQDEKAQKALKRWRLLKSTASK